MSVNFSPLKSNFGFSSPGFAVSNTGNLQAENLQIQGNATVNGTLYFNIISNINGNDDTLQPFSLLDTSDSTISLSPLIKNSSLTGLGVLNRLEVDGDVYIGIASTNFLTIDNGRVVVNNINLGSIENSTIGLITPAGARFTTATMATATITNTPTLAGHATRKDYVDSRISALSIALGS